MIMRRIVSSLLLCVLSFHLLAGLRAAEPEPDSLGGVYVSADMVRAVVPAQSLSGVQLKRLSTYSVSDALRYFSGVQIKDFGGIGGLKTVNVRSMGSQHVGVFYDGMQISNAQNGTVDLGRFSMDNMEVLSIYNGQKSETLQSAKDFASASALYMVTRRPRFDVGENDNVVLKLRSGSFDLANASILWDHRFSDRISASANVEALGTSGRYRYRYRKLDGYDVTEVRRNGDVTYLRAEAAMFMKLDGGEWFTKGYFYISDRGYPGAAVKKDQGIALLNEDRQKDRNFFLQSSLNRRVSDIYAYRVQVKYSNDYMNYVMPPESTVQPMDNHYWQQEVYLSSANMFTITDFWTAGLSADLQWNRLDATGTEMFNNNFTAPRRYTALAAASTSIDLDCGFKAQGSLLYTYVHDVSARNKPVSDDRHRLSPALVLSYRPWKRLDLTFRAFYKNIFRMPTFNDLYYVQLGNRNLKPETADQTDLGVTYRKLFRKGVLESFEVSVDGYYNEIKDKIIATPTSNQLVWTMVNLGFVRIAGTDVNIAPSFRFGEVRLNARLTYTYQWARDFTPGKESSGGTVVNVYGDQIPYIPLHSGSVIIGAVWKDWSLNYSFIYTGERYMLGGNIPVNYIQPWYTHDMSLSRAVSFSDVDMNISLEVNNIFNQQYEVVKWYPMPGTNFRVVLSLDF